MGFRNGDVLLESVYEKHEKPGGLLRYGIPNWKLEKQVIDRRVALLEAAGIKFICNTEIGKDISAEYIHRNFDYTFLAIGTPNARDLKIPGREAEGIYLALDYLHGAEMPDCKDPEKYNAKGKKVLIIGGGDTGNDCVGKAIREGCKSVLQVEFMPKPPETRSPSTPWPDWPYLLRTSYAHHEGGERRWNVSSKQFIVSLRSASRSSQMKFRILRKSSKLIWSCSPWASQAFRLKAS